MQKKHLRSLTIFSVLAILFVLSATYSVQASPPFQSPTPTPTGTPPADETCLLYDPTGTFCLMPAPPTCLPVPGENEFWPIAGDWARMHTVSATVNWFLRPVTKFFWWIEKIVAAVVGWLMSNSIWDTLWTSLMDGLRGLYDSGGAIERLMFGATGLAYIAISLAGISLILPFQTKFVRPEKAVVWGVLVMSLFITSGSGFDMINFIEEIRVATIDMILGASGAELDDLVAVPMKANAADMEDFSFALAPAFEDTYFPEPELEQREAILQLGCIMGAPLQTTVPFTVETTISMDDRALSSGGGVSLSILTLAPTYVLFLFGLSFAVLNAAAILLMVFFLALLPMGFFEFSEPIIVNTVKQYMYVFALTILISILAVILSAAVSTAFPAGDITVDVFVLWLPVLLIVGIMMGKVSGMAWGAMTGSFGTVSAAVTSVTSVAPAGGAGKEAKPLSSAGTMVATMGLAAVTGGVGAALVAGAGKAMGGSKTGQAVGKIAAASGTGRKAQTLAAATRGSGLDTTVGVVATNIRHNRRDGTAQQKTGREKQRREKAFDTTVGKKQAQLNPEWGAVQAGSVLTTNLDSLGQAEQHYFKKKDRRGARLELERAYGSADVAQDVMQVYQRDGKAGAARVRQVTEVTQATALGMEERGERVFDGQGKPSERYRQRLRQNLKRADAVDFSASDEETGRWGRIAGAVVRQTDSIWNDDQAAHKLARDTMTPEQSEVKSGDVSAQFKLRDLAMKMKWGEGELSALYDAVRSAQAASAQSGRPVTEEIVDQLKGSKIFRNVKQDDLQEAARLADMVADGAEVQKRGKVNLSQPVPLATAFDGEGYKQALKKQYRDKDPEAARKVLVQATGSKQGAESVQAAFGKHSPRAAAQLPEFIDTAQNVPPSYDDFGVPTDNYKKQVSDETVEEGRGDEQGAAFFDDVADDLLVELDTRLLNQTDQVAEAILEQTDSKVIGEAARELKDLANQNGWNKADVSTVVGESLMGASAQSVADVPPFEKMSKEDAGKTLATARDAAWEYKAAEQTDEKPQKNVAAKTMGEK